MEAVLREVFIMSHHEYDYAIIGSGLTGLAIAAAISQETSNVVLLEAQDHIGGYNREIQFPTGPMNNGLRFFPDTELAESSLLFLEEILGLKIIQKKAENSPLTYEDGQLKTFLSFGNTTPDFYEELVYFLNPKSIDLNLQPYQWTSLLAEKFKGEVLTRSFVTRFQIENGRVNSVLVNGSKSIFAKNFIFCGSIKQLQTLLPTDQLSSRVRHKISKSTYWTALCLDLCHGHTVNETDAIHVLNGTTVDEFGPSVGRFLKPQMVGEETYQTSQWTTFVEDQDSDESEIVGHALKKIKRQIKRAYPQAFDGIKTERILLASQIGGNGDLKVKANGTLPDVENLWIGSPTMNKQKNLVGSLLQAQLILASLGFQVGTVKSENALHGESASEEHSESNEVLES